MQKTENVKSSILILLVCLNGVLLATSNIVASKIVNVGGLTFAASALIYAFTFLITDIISEIWGERHAKWAVNAGMISIALMSGLIFIAVSLPPASIWTQQQEFEGILGSVPRIVLASLIAYAVSQHIDVYLYNKLRKVTGGKYLWLRNNASTIVSQFVDTVIFFGIGFASSLPFSTLIAVAAAQYAVKVVVALVDTALIYPIVSLIKSQPS